MKPPVVVIGGGIAGLAAALRLTEAGERVIVLETRKKLGGRATSFTDPRTGATLDNCQHVLMGCCTNLLDFYDRLGVLDLIEWHRTFYWTAGQGVIDEMKANLLPAPLHLARSFQKMTFLDRASKRAIARAMLRMIRMGERGRVEWQRRTFGEFLQKEAQPIQAIERFWKPVVISACNIDIDRCGASYALQVFQQGFLASKWAHAMGLPTVPLARLYDPAQSAIEAAGGEVHLGASVRGIAFDGKRISGVVTNDGAFDASAVISALPFERLAQLSSPMLIKADPRLQQLGQLEHSPILGVHLLFPQPIMELPHLTLVEHGTQWLFNKGVDAEGRQHLHAVISAADAWMELDEEAIVERVTDDVHDVLPGSRGIEPVEARSVKEKRATFAATPESVNLRPSAAPGVIGLGGGGVRNLFLAGDWCDTGWPATMEGAVRSGYLAAAALTGQGGLVEDLPAGAISRWLGMK